MNSAKRFLLCILLAIAAASNAGAALIVFGDSLSDEGNVRKASLDDPLLATDPPSPLYDPNGRMSNGPIWIDYLADRIGVARPTASLLGGTGYAYAGATTGNGQTARQSVTLPPFTQVQQVDNVGLQIANYQSTHPTGFAANDLVFLWAGANDLAGITLAALPMGVNAEAFGKALVSIAIANLQARLTTLNSLGATRVVVPNQLNASVAPFWNAPYKPAQIPAAAAGLLFILTNDFNTKLAAMLAALANTPGFNTFIIDVDLFSELGNFAGFGFSQTTDPFLADAIPPITGNPADYVFWDLIHPTTKAHEVIGARILAAVPEPTGASLLLAALAALALVGLKRRQHNVCRFRI